MERLYPSGCNHVRGHDPAIPVYYLILSIESGFLRH